MNDGLQEDIQENTILYHYLNHNVINYIKNSRNVFFMLWQNQESSIPEEAAAIRLLLILLKHLASLSKPHKKLAISPMAPYNPL